MTYYSQNYAGTLGAGLMCFLIGGQLMLDYDGNMALLKVNRHLTLFRIQHYNHPGLQGIPLH